MQWLRKSWLVLLCLLPLCQSHALPDYTTNLWDVIAFELGKEDPTVPPYRCTIGAHRGASVEYLENTLLALQTANQNPNFAFIEFDVQYSKDKQIVVFHDQHLFRLFRKLGAINNLTYKELYDLSVWGNRPLPGHHGCAQQEGECGNQIAGR